MRGIESAVTIDRPRRDVYAFVRDLENVAKLDPDVVSTARSEGEIEPGTTFRFRGKTPPLGRERDTTIRLTTLRPNEAIEFEGEVGPMRPKGGFSVEPSNGQTRLLFWGEPNPQGLAKLLSPLVTRQGKRLWDRRLERVKNHLESPHSVHGTGSAAS